MLQVRLYVLGCEQGLGIVPEDRRRLIVGIDHLEHVFPQKLDEFTEQGPMPVQSALAANVLENTTLEEILARPGPKELLMPPSDQVFVADQLHTPSIEARRVLFASQIVRLWLSLFILCGGTTYDCGWLIPILPLFSPFLDRIHTFAPEERCKTMRVGHLYIRRNVPILNHIIIMVLPRETKLHLRLRLLVLVPILHETLWHKQVFR